MPWQVWKIPEQQSQTSGNRVPGSGVRPGAEPKTSPANPSCTLMEDSLHAGFSNKTSATKPLQIGVLMAENRVLLHTPSWHLAAVGITSVQYWEGSQNPSNRLAPFVTSVFSPPLPTSTGHPTGCGRAGILLHQRLSCASSPASDHRGAPGTHSKVPRSAPKQRASWDLLWSLLEVLM